MSAELVPAKPNWRELNYREDAQKGVRHLWSELLGKARVQVEPKVAQLEFFMVDVPAEEGNEAFHHPYYYASAMGKLAVAAA